MATNRMMQRQLPLSKPQRRVLTAMQCRGADAQHNRVDIGAAYSTLFVLEELKLVEHKRDDPETWWLTERGKRVSA